MFAQDDDSSVHRLPRSACLRPSVASARGGVVAWPLAAVSTAAVSVAGGFPRRRFPSAAIGGGGFRGGGFRSAAIASGGVRSRAFAADGFARAPVTRSVHLTHPPVTEGLRDPGRREGPEIIGRGEKQRVANRAHGIEAAADPGCWTRRRRR